MDRRIIKTRKSIFDAFYKLIQKRDYNKISVQNVIDVANIGRSTFYEHFETKDDLLKAMCTDLFEHIFDSDNDVKSSSSWGACEYFETSANETCEVLRVKFTHVLYHLLEDKEVIKGILKSEGSDVFIRYFKEYLIKSVSNIPLLTHLPRDFALNHVASSFIEAIKWWANKNFDLPPETLSDFVIKTFAEKT